VVQSHLAGVVREVVGEDVVDVSKNRKDRLTVFVVLNLIINCETIIVLPEILW